MKIASVATLYALEHRAHNALKIAEPSLMEKAAHACARYIHDFKQQHTALRELEIIILAGRGNNGGDGILAGGILHTLYHEKVTIFHLSPISGMSDEIRRHFLSLPSDLSVKFISNPSNFPDLKKPCLIVDSLLGIGFKGELKSPVKELIESVNFSENPVISIDIPSGINADTGIGNDAVFADMTISIGAQKRGLFCANGRIHAGTVKFADIGFDIASIPENECEFEAIDDALWKKCFSRPANELFKNRNGRLLIIGGSKLYPGAVVLAIEGANAAGCGLITAAIKERPYSPIPPNIIVRNFQHENSTCFNENDFYELKEIALQQNCIVAGMGMTANNDTSKFIGRLLSLQIPMVLDADALNAIASAPEIWQNKNTEKIIASPHPKEAERLASAFGIKNFTQLPRFSQAAVLSEKMQCTIILKGDKTFIASPDGALHVNPTGNYALAKGGSGDILSGIAGALFARNLQMSPHKIACSAVYLHGIAADHTVQSRSAFNISTLPDALRSFLNCNTVF